MKVCFFSASQYDIEVFGKNNPKHDIRFFSESLKDETIKLATDSNAICISPYNKITDLMLKNLALSGPSLIVVRSSNLDNIDLNAAQRYQITVKGLPGFAPHAIAEHALALLLALNRKIPQALGRVSQGDFTTDGLMGFNLHEKTIGIIGLGRIGSTFARIMLGFGCRVIAFDPLKRTDSTIEDIMFLSLKELFKQSDIISLHCDQNELSSGIVSRKALKTVKPNLILINTARGKLVDTAAVLDALKEHKISGYGADVYENDEAVFLHKFGSIEKIKDPLLLSLIQQPGVVITPHIGYLTFDAMQQAARTIINELTYYESRRTNEPFDQLMI